MLIIYSKNNCDGCERTKKKLYELGIDYEVRNITGNKPYLDELISYYDNDSEIGLPTVVMNDVRVSSGYPSQAEWEIICQS